MNVNPEDYDPEELRRMAADRRDRDHPERRTDGHSGAETGGPGEEPQSRWDGPGDDPQRGFDRRNGRHDQYDGRADRSRARSPVRGNPGSTRGVAADALRSNQLEQLFLHQSAMVAEEMTKPYLGSLPQKYAAERVIFDWLEFLVLKGGFKRTMDALRYYRTIQWITPDVEDALQDYLVGFTEDGQGSHDLDVDDHQLSLLYVARLASMS
jgi:archaellum component FlaD/FlaE